MQMSWQSENLGTQVDCSLPTGKGTLQHLTFWDSHTQKPSLHIAHLSLIRCSPLPSPAPVASHHPTLSVSEKVSCMTVSDSSTLNSEDSGNFLDKANSTASWTVRNSWALVMPVSKKSFFSSDLTTKATNQTRNIHRVRHLGRRGSRTQNAALFIGGRILTVTSCNEHQDVGVLESTEHLWGESKPVIEIFTLGRGKGLLIS